MATKNTTTNNKTKDFNFDKFFENVKIENSSNCFGANAIYKPIKDFQENTDFTKYLKSDGVSLNRNKIRKDFKNLLGKAVIFEKNKGYQITDEENVKKFMKFCVNIYSCFNKTNANNYKLYNIENLCKSNKEENLQYIRKQIELVQNFIKENY